MAYYYAGQIVSDLELNTGTDQIDLTTTIVTAAALTAGSKLWDIPAGVAMSGSSWRLTVIGKVVMGTTQLLTNWYIGMGPSGATQIEIVQAAAADIPASDTIHFTAVIHQVVNAFGSTGNASVFGTISWGDAASSHLEWTNGSTAHAFDTTVDNKLCFLFSFAATTGAPAMTSYCSIFERMS
jgi:hypothetical protein